MKQQKKLNKHLAHVVKKFLAEVAAVEPAVVHQVLPKLQFFVENDLTLSAFRVLQIVF